MRIRMARQIDVSSAPSWRGGVSLVPPASQPAARARPVRSPRAAVQNTGGRLTSGAPKRAGGTAGARRADRRLDFTPGRLRFCAG
jgi:hypothetical protein